MFGEDATFLVRFEGCALMIQETDSVSSFIFFLGGGGEG
jgi:hypothetical protein